eukprot:gene10264-biopygen8342
MFPSPLPHTPSPLSEERAPKKQSSCGAETKITNPDTQHYPRCSGIQPQLYPWCSRMGRIRRWAPIAGGAAAAAVRLVDPFQVLGWLRMEYHVFTLLLASRHDALKC